MSASNLVRVASRAQSITFLRPPPSTRRQLAARPGPAIVLATAGSVQPFHSSARKLSGGGEETFEQFNSRYETEFNNVQDVFELQRNLNNSFAYDLVPSLGVCTAALRAARRVNDFPTAVRIFEGIKVKVENKGQYDEYLRELEPVRKELGIDLAEDLYPDPRFRAPRW